VSSKITLAAVATTTTISKSFMHYLSNIPEKHELKELQKNSHTGHCSHTSESADIKVQNIFNM